MPALDQLERQYQDSLESKQADLRRSFDALCDEDATEPQVRHLHQLLHRLSGSAGTYGYLRLGRKAQAMTQVWSQWLKQAPDARIDVWRLCAEHAEAMEDLLQAIGQASLDGKDA